VRFQRIAGRDDPPEFIEIELRESFACGEQVTFVRGIERPSHQADAAATPARHLYTDGSERS
jgi:hypothetical protein